MLSPAQIDHYAAQLLAARGAGKSVRPFPANAKITEQDAYLIARRIEAKRIARGEVVVGRKIGFANQRILSKYGRNSPIKGLIWTPLFSNTVRYMENTYGIQSLRGAMQPRLAPEIIFKLRTTPTRNATVLDIANCLEWMAHGMEVVVCPFPNWEFNMEDAIAAFGLHGALLIGEPHQLASTTRHHLGNILKNTTLSLSCNDTLISAGFGSDLLESPLHAVWHLQQLLKHQPETTTLQAGEIISTGTWTDLPTICAGQTWISAFSGANLTGIAVSFV